jgi:hypothetical protein
MGGVGITTEVFFLGDKTALTFLTFVKSFMGCVVLTIKEVFGFLAELALLTVSVCSR